MVSGVSWIARRFGLWAAPLLFAGAAAAQLSSPPPVAPPLMESRLGFVGSAYALVDIYDARVERGRWTEIPAGATIRDGEVFDRDGKSIGASSDPGRMVSHAKLIPAPERASFDPTAADGVALADEPELWHVRVNGAPRRVAGIWRRTAAETVARVGQGEIAYRQLCALALDPPLAPGDFVEVEAPGAAAPLTATFAMSWRSEAVQTSQIGYEPGQTKRAHVGLWLGLDRDGAPLTTDALLAPGRSWRIVNAQDGSDVGIGGRLALERRGGDKVALPKGVTVATGYDVHVADFSSLRAPGRYRLVVEGIGSSHPFVVAPGVHLSAFRHVARGLFHARRGQDHGPPYTDWRRPAIMLRSHRRSTLAVAGTTEGLGDLKKFAALAEAPWRGEVMPAFGWQDAGDYDTRPQHLTTARDLMRIADLFPAAAALDLGIPESGRPYDRSVAGARAWSTGALPDLLQEALWAVDHWRHTQEADGGVHGGYEIGRYVADTGHVGWSVTPGIEAYEYAPDPWASYAYAASAAMAARFLIERAEPGLGAVYAASARAALRYARREETSLPESLRKSERFVTEKMDAALQALALDAVWPAEPGTPPEDPALLIALLAGGAPRLRTDPALDYALLARAGRIPADSATLDAIERGARIDLDMLLRTGVLYFSALRQRDEGWRYGLGPAHPRATLRTLRRAWLLGPGEHRERIAGLIERDVLFGLGANPTNMTTITGLGLKPPSDVLHNDMRALGDAGPPPGLPMFGPIPSPVIVHRRAERLYAQRSRPSSPDRLPHPMRWESAGFNPKVAEWTPQGSFRGWLWALALIDSVERDRARRAN